MNINIVVEKIQFEFTDLEKRCGWYVCLKHLLDVPADECCRASDDERASRGNANGSTEHPYQFPYSPSGMSAQYKICNPFR